MATNKQSLMGWLGNQLELPKDVTLDLPRMTMVGQLHIYVENHRGLLAFSENEVRLRLKSGQLRIRGEGFVIKNILRDEMLLEGKIVDVTFLPSVEGNT
ncbi:MAG: sporulation protein YqfC [Bacilli bacterium]